MGFNSAFEGLNPELSLKKQLSERRRFFFQQQTQIEFKKEASKALNLGCSFFVVLKLGHFRK